MSLKMFYRERNGRNATCETLAFHRNALSASADTAFLQTAHLLQRRKPCWRAISAAGSFPLELKGYVMNIGRLWGDKHPFA